MLETKVLNGKVKVLLKNKGRVEETFKLEKCTMEKIERMANEWDLTNSQALELIIKCFDKMYDGVEMKEESEEPSNPKEAKDERINKVKELISSGITSKQELAEIVNVSMNTIKSYMKELRKEGFLENIRETEKKEKEERILKTIKLRELNIYSRRELAEIVGVSKNTMDSYIQEINKMMSEEGIS